MDVYDESLFVVLKPLRYVEKTSDIETGDMMLFVGDHFVVTVRRGEGNPSAGPARLEQRRALAYGPTAVLYAVMDAIVDNYADIDAEMRRTSTRWSAPSSSGRREVGRRPRSTCSSARSWRSGGPSCRWRTR